MVLVVCLGSRVVSPGSQVFGSLASGRGYLVLDLGSWVLGLCRGYRVLGIGSLVLCVGTWVSGLGSWVVCLRSWVLGLGSSVLSRGFVGLGYWVVGRKSWVVCRGSWVLEIGHCVVGLGSGVVGIESCVLGLRHWGCWSGVVDIGSTSASTSQSQPPSPARVQPTSPSQLHVCPHTKIESADIHIVGQFGHAAMQCHNWKDGNTVARKLRACRLCYLLSGVAAISSLLAMLLRPCTEGWSTSGKTPSFLPFCMISSNHTVGAICVV